ncbi:MAG: lipid II flippase MurJ [Acidimicrobiales bacterium]
MTAATAPPSAAAGPGGDGVGRAAAIISAWNLVARLTGFARVLALGAALGTTALGDAYQSANLVSNILFELLAGGMLSAVLVPTFVARIEAGDRPGAARLAGRLLGVAGTALAVVVAVGMVTAPLLMRALTAGVGDGADRERQIEVGAFLLVFFLPQVLLYAVGAVASALLQAERRFAAAAAAPVANNLVVIATMIAFAMLAGGSTDLGVSTGPLVVLAIGTTAGVLAMTAVPLVAIRRAGTGLRPRRPAPGAERGELRALAGRGLWAAGHLGANQALVAVTIVLAGAVTGGVVAYQIAFTFFLLPHALAANPIFTALFPRLAAAAAAGRREAFAADLAAGLRAILFLVLPAAALLAALALPALRLVRVGALDGDGADLVASVLAAYCVGLVGYSGFFLLTRAAYALDDVRSPTVVNAVATVVGIVAMVGAWAAATGDGRVVVLGLVHGAVVTVATVALHRRVVRRTGVAVPVGGALLRAGVAAAAAAGVAWLVADLVGSATRAEAAAALAAGGGAGVTAYLLAQLALGSPEVRNPRAVLRGTP